MVKPTMHRVIAGTDEVGRGPLAGDVVAAAVVLGPSHGIDGLADSKKLTERKRETLYDQIQARACAWCIARASVEEIDQLNILQASLLAMKRAVDGLSIAVDHVLVDGNQLPSWDYSCDAIVQGDSIVPEISAASILAKVTRDREMIAFEQHYPGYGFAKHKGYPTKVHMAALQRLGPCKIHRRSYAPVKKYLHEGDSPSG